MDDFSPINPNLFDEFPYDYNQAGTGILSAGSGEIHQARLNFIANGIKFLREKEDTDTIVVSSGAVGLEWENLV